MEKKKIEAGCRIWFEKDGETFLAPGKAALLAHIADKGSLRKAAAEMNMSYRKAWYSIQQLNENAPQTMVVLHRGGAKGGNAEITGYGKHLLEQYDELCIKTKAFMDEALRNISF